MAGDIHFFMQYPDYLGAAIFEPAKHYQVVADLVHEAAWNYAGQVAVVCLASGNLFKTGKKPFHVNRNLLLAPRFPGVGGDLT